ncbi:MAG: hypothetical protein J0M07_29135 [Anaerolineae bacterium]|nr:hypothetical protein [Anaerolineae bacterium]
MIPDAAHERPRPFQFCAVPRNNITAPQGIFFIASCSHNAPLIEFTEAVARGITDAGRSGRLLKTSGAGTDHPVHLQLPENTYLKALTFALD